MPAIRLLSKLRFKFKWRAFVLVLGLLLFIFPEIHASAVPENTLSTPNPLEKYLKNFKKRPGSALPAPFVHDKPLPDGWVPPDFTHGDRNGTKVAVTFDGGISGREASEILDILKRRRIKTTIFLTGSFITRYPDITRRIVADGHEVGNHSLSHPHLTDFDRTKRHTTLKHVTREFLLRQLRETEALFRKVTGTEMAPLWRAPYGEINRELRGWAFSAGYLHVGWTSDYKRRKSLDSLDWVYIKTSPLYLTPGEIKKRILTFDKGGGHIGGGIVLMHLGTERRSDRASTILGEMLDSLITRGYSVVKVSDMIKDKAALRAARRNKVNFYNTKTLYKRHQFSGPS